jgi:adenylylsulfate kinase
MEKHLYPVAYISTAQKLTFLSQNNLVIWLTGLSGAGKSTIAKLLEQQLFADRFLSAVLDGDNLRTGLCNNLTFTEADRTENVRRIAETAKILAQNGFIVLVASISPQTAMRQMAKNIVGEIPFLEIFINASLTTCQQRDVKGLYKKAQHNQIANFTAVSQPYENPENPFLTINTAETTAQESANFIYKHVLPFIKKS